LHRFELKHWAPLILKTFAALRHEQGGVLLMAGKTGGLAKYSSVLLVLGGIVKRLGRDYTTKKLEYYRRNYLLNVKGKVIIIHHFAIN